MAIAGVVWRFLRSHLWYDLYISPSRLIALTPALRQLCACFLVHVLLAMLGHFAPARAICDERMMARRLL